MLVREAVYHTEPEHLVKIRYMVQEGLLLEHLYGCSMYTLNNMNKCNEGRGL